MAILTKNALSASNQASFPNNTTGAITPLILRNFNQDVIDTLVDSLNTGSYAVTTGSNDFTQPNNFTSISASSFVSASQFVGDGSKLTNITASIALPILDEGVLQGYATSMNFTGSAISATIVGGTAVVQVNIDNVGLVTTASFNAYTQSTNQFTASTNTSITNLNASSASQQVSINNLNTTTASLLVETQNLELFSSSTLTRLTNIENTTASLNSSVTQLNASSASQQISINALNTFTASQSTASIVTSITNLNTFSASALVSISNLNSTTASLNSSVTQLNANTASQQVSINALNSATASYVTETESGSFLITASVNLNTITFTKGNNTTFAVTVNTGSATTTDLTSLNAFTQSQYVSNSFFATTASFNSYTSSNNQRVSSLEAATSSYVTESETGSFARYDVSNPWSANQTFTNITAVSASFTYIQTTYETASVIYSSGSNQFGDELSDTQTLSGSVKVQGSLTVNGTPVLTSSVDISGLTTTASFNAYTQSNDSKVNSLINATASYATSAITASSLITASAVGNTITFTKGDTSTFAVSVSSTPIDTGSLVTTASFNAYTSSNDQKVNSLIAATGSYATTGSNTFTGNQTISSSLFISGNINMVNGSDLVTHHVKAAGSNGLELQTSAGTNIVAMGAGGGTQAVFVGAVSANSISASTINGLGDPLAFSTSVDSRLDNLEGVSGSFVTTSSFNSYTSSTNSRLTNIETTTASLLIETSNLETFSSSALISLSNLNTATASLFTSASLSLTTASFAGNTLTFTKGNGTTFGVVIPDVSGSTINTGSFATTGSNSFNGNQTITGSLILSSSNAVELTVIGNMVVTGSAFGNVVSMSITANTASMDLSRGNYFTLTLADTATTHISASNVQPGVSATLVITTGTNSSASLAPTMLQPSGSTYSATNGSAKKDVLSIVAVASGVPFVVSTKNMI